MNSESACSLSGVPALSADGDASLAKRLGQRGDVGRVGIVLRDRDAGAVAERDLAADDDLLRERVVIRRHSRAGAAAASSATAATAARRGSRLGWARSS